MSGEDSTDDLDPRINPARQISLTRSPKLSSDLAEYYPYCDEEQDVIKQAMREMLRQHQNGITPTDLLATFQQFVEATSDELTADADLNGRVRFHCDVTGSELELEEADDELSVDVSVTIEDDE